ncbi:DUF1566 domain-containing protein [Thauera butanivorans]|uniref:DUF1566 domain-containing protein n=1 Tax=Thauera butanivorans TaxID=86174 RepID=UPI000839A5B5|nr:DUF1566 domain-containing protein [Thauera butanivorans]
MQTSAPFLIALPDLAPGEIWAGIAVEDGAPAHHLILLPGDVKGVTHEAATEWAASIGGGLPTRKEQALLFANLKDQFEEAAYWSAQRRESDPDYAWYQHFGFGNQGYTRRDTQLRARAVRRLPI